MYEEIITEWIEHLGQFIEGFDQEIELATKAADPYPPEESYVSQCENDIKACVLAVKALESLRDALAQPKPDES